jgi:hypothetical protein
MGGSSSGTTADTSYGTSYKPGAENAWTGGNDSRS